MSSEPENLELVEQTRGALRRLTSEIDGLDARAAQYFGVNRTDQHCLDLLASRGPLTPSELAQEMSLSSGGMTIALERLERAGMVTRRLNPGDRRSVLVEATDLTRRLGREFFGPLASAERELLGVYPPERLQAIHDFLDGLAAAIAQLGGQSPARLRASDRASSASDEAAASAS